MFAQPFYKTDISIKRTVIFTPRFYCIINTKTVNFFSTGGATNDSSEDDIAKNVLASSGSDGETEAAPKAAKKKRVIA